MSREDDLRAELLSAARTMYPGAKPSRRLRIIGIVGRKREGKDTVLSLLRDYVAPTPVQRRALADPIKVFARKVWDLSEEQTDGDLKESLDERWGCTPRKILQHLGTEVARGIHADTWVRYLIRSIERDMDSREYHENTIWVVPDVRFVNEAGWIQAHGGLLWRVRRFDDPGTDSHASEREIDAIRVDRTIENKGSLDDLRRAIAETWRHMPSWEST